MIKILTPEILNPNVMMIMNQKFYFLFTLLSLISTASMSQEIITVTDGDLEGGQTYNWTKGNVYLLDGFVFLEEGGVLNIEAGTVIKGKNQPSNGVDNASALIITRGAQIFAEGTRLEPIIFTAELDDVNDPNDLGKQDKGLWGGLIILGNGVVGINGDEGNIEGIPADETRARYGGNDNGDDSGVLRYISIRHGGADLQSDNEINGLTLGGVGNGTEIDYVEIFANLDDGIEWFGGAVDVKHASVAFVGDDSYDYDQSWGGRGQFWFSIGDDTSNSGGEHDGSEKADKTPKDFPTIFNATYIGSGPDRVNHAVDLRDDAAVVYANSIFTDFGGDGLRVRNANEQDCYARVVAGDTRFLNNIWWAFAAGDNPADFIKITEDNGTGDIDVVLQMITDGLNEVSDPMLFSISRIADEGLDPRPMSGSPATDGAVAPTDEWFEATSYRGAFSDSKSESDQWALGWTALDQYGHLGFNIGNSTYTPTYSADNGFVLSSSPNPVMGSEMNLSFTIPYRTLVTIDMYDMQGRLVRTYQRNQEYLEGEYNVPVNTSDLERGMYFVTLQSGSVRIARKVVVAR